MKVVLAHGTFDLLHAGHVAYLEAAKAMGDYLVVGITADEYVQKGTGRPAVCDLDRARAVAALRCVDTVFIDDHPTPEHMIGTWRPAIFVKGADYAGQELPEQAWVARYGGEVRFTNGDTMYHSRQWLTGDARATMEQQGVQVADLLEILNQACGWRIHVVGDLIVDEVADGEMIGPLTLRVARRERYLGGAAAVALHAAGAGAQVTFTYPRGTDAVADWAAYEMGRSTVRRLGIHTPSRLAPLKARYYGGEGLLCQIDEVDSTPCAPEMVRRIAGLVSITPTDAVLCADYRHGVFHADSLPVLRAAIPEHALKVADSQVASRWGNILDFAGFDLVTPNEREARWAVGLQDGSAEYVAAQVQNRGAFPHVLLTQGAQGLVGIDQGAAFTVPALATQAVDAVGAGDALLAYATLGLLASGSLATAAWLGSVAAAIACSRRGNSPVTAAEVRAWLERL